jgi:hypothetical protein
VPTAEELTLSGGVLVAVVIVGLAILALDVFCIVDVVRRPAVLGGRKWVWILVICLFNLIGPIVYLAVGRVPAPAAEPQQSQGATAADRAAAAADLLYGPAPPTPPAPDAPRRPGEPPAAP